MALENPEALVTKRPFYKRPWGIVLIIVGVFVLIVLILYVVMVSVFYRRIMSGEDLSYLNQNQGFTRSELLDSGLDIEIAEVATTDDPSLGPIDAPLTIVEFLDFECPFCLEMFPIIREFVAAHPEQIRYIVRDFPLEDIHPDARRAAEAAACAHDQDRFWSYHDKLFQNQTALTEDDLFEYAQAVGLDNDQFTRCLNNGEQSGEVQADFAAGLAAGVVGTPTFFVNGRKFEGVIPGDVWEQILQVTDVL